MTHDELLEELDEVIKDFDQKYDNSNPYYKALRAVVELHKPTPENRYPENICQGCSMTEEVVYVYYPCQTIQAIEKELS